MDIMTQEDRSFSEVLDQLDAPFRRLSGDPKSELAFDLLESVGASRLTSQVTIGSGLHLDIGALDTREFEQEGESVMLLQRLEVLMANLAVRQQYLTSEQLDEAAKWLAASSHHVYWSHDATSSNAANPQHYFDHRQGDALDIAASKYLLTNFACTLRETYISPQFRQEHMGAKVSAG